MWGRSTKQRRAVQRRTRPARWRERYRRLGLPLPTLWDAVQDVIGPNASPIFDNVQQSTHFLRREG